MAPVFAVDDPNFPANSRNLFYPELFTGSVGEMFEIAPYVVLDHVKDLRSKLQ